MKNMDKFSDRLNLVIEYLGMNKNGFAEAIGQPAASIYNYERREGTPALSVIQKIRNRFPIVNMEFLLFNEGEPVTVIMQAHESSYAPKASRVGEMVTVPIVSMKTAEKAFRWKEGDPAIEAIDSLTIPKWMLKNGIHVAVQVKGISMQPSIYDNSIVLFRKLERGQWHNFINQGVHFVLTENYGVQIKYLVSNERNHRLVSMESEMADENPPVVIDMDDILLLAEMEVNIGFKVVSLQRNITARVNSFESIVRDIQFDLDNMKLKLKAK